MTNKNYIWFTVIIAAFFTASYSAKAQIALSGFGATEIDGHDGAFVFSGLSASRAGKGWSPIVGVSAYWLRYATGPSTTNSVTGVAPSIGLQNTLDVGSYSLGVEYVFLNDDVDINEAGALVSGGENGPAVTLNAIYWGTGNRMAQIYAAYNIKDQFFGTEMRGLLRAGGERQRPIYYGMDFGLLGGGDEADKYFQGRFGPVLQVNWSPVFRTALGAGIKIDNGSRSSPFPYLKLDFSISR